MPGSFTPPCISSGGDSSVSYSVSAILLTEESQGDIDMGIQLESVPLWINPSLFVPDRPCQAKGAFPVKGLCCSGTGSVDATLGVDKGCYVLGETINIFGSIKNCSISDIKEVSIRLKHKITVSAKFDETVKTAKFHDKVVLSGASQSLALRAGETDPALRLSLTLPATTGRAWPHRIGVSVTAAFRVEVTFRFGGCKQSVVTIPVTVIIPDPKMMVLAARAPVALPGLAAGLAVAEIAMPKFIEMKEEEFGVKDSHVTRLS
jgi:hypothetical protein